MELAAYFTGEDNNNNTNNFQDLSTVNTPTSNVNTNINNKPTTRLTSFDRILLKGEQELNFDFDFDYENDDERASSVFDEEENKVVVPRLSPDSPTSSSSVSSPCSVYSPYSPDSELSEFLKAEQNPRKGGRKQGSTIYCDQALINRLLPMTTKKFNQEIKTLSLTEDEISKLKFARRRIKNARAAQKRRLRTSESLKTLQVKVHQLLKERTDIEKKLKLALAENDVLRTKLGNS